MPGLAVGELTVVVAVASSNSVNKVLIILDSAAYAILCCFWLPLLLFHHDAQCCRLDVYVAKSNMVGIMLLIQLDSVVLHDGDALEVATYNM